MKKLNPRVREIFHQLSPSLPSWSSSRDVCLSVCLMSLPDVFFKALTLWADAFY